MSDVRYKTIFNSGEQALQLWTPINDARENTGVCDVLDFFCCAGGMSLGFDALKNYFKIVGGIDLNKTALVAYNRNFNAPTLNVDIREVRNNMELLSTIFGIDTNHHRPLIIIGCAPCQGFSAHRKKDRDKPEDERNTLIGEFAEIAVALEPDYVVMENVPEILTDKYKRHYEEAKQVFEDHGYKLNQKIYNAAGFGVPQARFRAIIVASKNNFEMPNELLQESDYKTVRDAIGDLPPITPKHPCISDIYHRCTEHKQSTIDVISQVPKNGGNRPRGVGPTCLEKVKGFYDVYGRLAWHKPSVTITQYARNPASGRFSHPEQNRGLSIREAARLQSFPDGYLWNGSLGENFQQIGEAVPPLLALAIASQIALTL